MLTEVQAMKASYDSSISMSTKYSKVSCAKSKSENVSLVLKKQKQKKTINLFNEIKVSSSF